MAGEGVGDHLAQRLALVEVAGQCHCPRCRFAGLSQSRARAELAGFDDDQAAATAGLQEVAQRLDQRVLAVTDANDPPSAGKWDGCGLVAEPRRVVLHRVGR